MRNIYLINLSFGLAGTERRFANIWHTLRARGNVRPILAIPDVLALKLSGAGLIDPSDPDVWSVVEPSWSRALERLRLPGRGEHVGPFVRSRVVARRYAETWRRIRDDASAVIHVGLNCSALEPPPGPIVYECMDSTLTQLGTEHYAKAARRRSIVHCQTDRIREVLERENASRHPRWQAVTSPTYFATYPPADDRIARDPALVAFVGRFAPEKHPLLFVDAVASLRKAGRPIRALMLGEGPLRGAVQQRISDHGLEGHIEIGFDKAPFQRLQSAAVYVSIQDGDNYGSQSLLEAMGAGCAIVASDVGETARIVTERIGRRVGFDVADLAGAIDYLITNPRGTARMGAEASRLARSEYSADRYVAFVESLYELAVTHANE